VSAVLAPVSETERYEALDLLRGFAVLGILVMNIQSFAMPFSAYLNPTALGQPAALDYAIWSAKHLLADQKFMTMFSLLFGAGVLFMARRVADRGGRPAMVHYRRMFWLLLFGLFHAYVLWYGDILVLYAVCGAVIFPLRRFAPRTRLMLGLFVLAIGTLLNLVAGLSMPSWPPENVAEMMGFWAPDAARLEHEIAAYQGGWLAQLSHRAEAAFGFHVFHMWYWGIWRAGGVMLIGMALLDWKVLTGERAPAFYAKLAAAGFGLGLPLVAAGLWSNHTSGWTLDAFFIGGIWNYWGSVLVSLGWLGLVVRLWHAGVLRGLARRLVAAGRMAFTCYILETLICTTIFYGHGLGLFGTVNRLGQVVVVIGVWVVLLLFAPWWLARYRMGPLEWLWRSLTYGTAGPLRRRAGPPRPVVA